MKLITWNCQFPLPQPSPRLSPGLLFCAEALADASKSRNRWPFTPWCEQSDHTPLLVEFV